jgi:hypothetical protein
MRKIMKDTIISKNLFAAIIAWRSVSKHSGILKHSIVCYDKFYKDKKLLFRTPPPCIACCYRLLPLLQHTKHENNSL